MPLQEQDGLEEHERPQDSQSPLAVSWKKDDPAVDIKDPKKDMEDAQKDEMKEDETSVDIRDLKKDIEESEEEGKRTRSRTQSLGAKRNSRTGVVYARATSIESPGGRRLLKNISRVDSVERDNSRVPLFRLNSVVKDVGTIQEEGEEPERQQWDSPLEFLLSCISMSVGLGNVWRFPFTAYENGGGAFLIPYILVLMFVGRPLYLLELGLGQFSSSGSVRVWDMVPAFGGVGYGQVIATGCVTTYYCSLIGLAIYYLVVSCYPTLPWTMCDEIERDNTVCIPTGGNKSDYVTCHFFNSSMSPQNTAISNSSGLNSPELNSTINSMLSNVLNYTSSTVCVQSNSTEEVTENTENVTIQSSAEQFFKFSVLKENTDISDGLGLPDPVLAGCLAVCWLLIYLSLRKGVSSSGKVAYFTAIFPYLVMFTLLIRGLTLTGAGKGLTFFFTPQWHRLGDLKVWYAAVTQSFFSLSVGFGTLQTYASYNKFRHNTARDALIISFADTFTSLLAGTIIFSILGHLAHELDLPVEKVVKSGAGLAFISYPEVLAKFTFAPQLFAVLFFLMLITLGLGSAIGLFSAVTTTICDSFPNANRKTIIKICCVIGLAIGMFYVTPGGQVMLEMVDYYGGTMLILVLASLEIIAINWVYGTNTVIRDLNFMLDTKLSFYWKFCWAFLCPLLLPLLFFYVIITQAGVPNIPDTAKMFGWLIAGLGMLVVPAHFLLSLTAEEEEEYFYQRLWAATKKGLLMQRAKESFQPNSQWGPSAVEERKAWQVAEETEDAEDKGGILVWLRNSCGGKK